MSEPVNLDEQVSYWRRKYEAIKDPRLTDPTTEFVGPENQELREQVVHLKAEREGYRAQIAEVEKRYDGSIEALIKVRKEREEWRMLALKQTAALEYAHAALATQTDELAAYKDYYGTSPAQARHLTMCEECYQVGAYKKSPPPATCPDYPTE